MNNNENKNDEYDDMTKIVIMTMIIIMIMIIK